MRDRCPIRSYRTMSGPPWRESRGFLQIVSNQLLLAYTKTRSRHTHNVFCSGCGAFVCLCACASRRHLVSHLEKDIGTKAEADATARTKHTLHFIVLPSIPTLLKAVVIRSLLWNILCDQNVFGGHQHVRIE